MLETLLSDPLKKEKQPLMLPISREKLFQLSYKTNEHNNQSVWPINQKNQAMFNKWWMFMVRSALSPSSTKKIKQTSQLDYLKYIMRKCVVFIINSIVPL